MPKLWRRPRPTLQAWAARGVRHTAFAVATEDDLGDAYFALQDAGVPILRAIDHVSQKSIYFHGPDRNLLEIVWERPNALEIFAKGRGDEDKPLVFSCLEQQPIES